VTARPDAASSSSLSGTALVVVVVVDVNDNSPTFAFPSPSNDTVRVSSAAPVGHVIAHLSARDDDAGDNARLTFGCHRATTRSVGDDEAEPEDVDEVDEPFSVGAESGAVAVARSLSDIDFRVYDVALYVVDGGQPVRSGTATLKIVVNRTIPFDGGGRRRRGGAQPGGKGGRDRADGDVVQSTDSLMGSPPPPPPPASTDVATVRAAVSPYKRNGVVPASQSLRCLTDDVDVRASPTRLDSAFYPPWDGKMSTSQTAVMLCSWGVKAGMVRATCG